MASTFSILSIILIIYGIYRWRHPRPPRVPLLWRGRHVIITGGSSGLGLALAEYVAAKGASITIIARDPGRLEDAVESCRSVGIEETRVQGFSRDVARGEDIMCIIRHACTVYGPPNYVFCCAGLCIPEMFVKEHPENLKTMMNTNYFGTVNTVYAALSFIDPDSMCTLVAVTSVCAYTTFAGFSGYSASKAAVRFLWDTLRNEHCVDKHLRWHVYAPSTIDSPGLRVEEENKPSVTRAIEGSVKKHSPDAAARHLITGMENGHYVITQGRIEFLLYAGAQGTAPRARPVLEILGAFWITLFNVIVGYYYNWRVRKHKDKAV